MSPGSVPSLASCSAAQARQARTAGWCSHLGSVVYAEIAPSFGASSAMRPKRYVPSLQVPSYRRDAPDQPHRYPSRVLAERGGVGALEAAVLRRAQDNRPQSSPCHDPARSGSGASSRSGFGGAFTCSSVADG